MLVKEPVIIDGDPGHDDAIALVLACAYKDYFDIKAITSCAGNQTIDKTTLNYRRIATLLNLNVPIAAGRDKPMIKITELGKRFHGESGLDGPKLPEPNIDLTNMSAVYLMAKVLKESDKQVTIIATGPQTNVATLLLAHPELKNKIKQISIMGGGLVHGNWNVSAEFNIYFDPESADVVFRSGIPIIMAGLDVTEKAEIFPNEWKKINELNNQVAKTVAGWFDFFFIHLSELGFKGATLHDPVAVMYLIHPEIFKTKDVYVQIDTKGEYTQGATCPDYFGLTGNKPNTKAIMDLDREAFVKELYKACESFN